jgi:hypothetical protein
VGAASTATFRKPRKVGQPVSFWRKRLGKQRYASHLPRFILPRKRPALKLCISIVEVSMESNDKPSTDQRKRDWVDTSSKLLIPILIFAAGAVLSYQKDRSDQANKDFQLESEVLKQATSKDLDEQKIGLIRLRILQKRRSQVATEIQEVVDDRDKIKDLSSKNARDILVQNVVAAATQGQTTVPPPNSTQVPKVYIQIASESQRPDASRLADKLKSSNFGVEDLDLVAHPTFNNYVRYFSVDGKQSADKVLEAMKDMGFKTEEQDFTGTADKSSSPPLSVEVWLGQRQKPLSLRDGGH